MGNKFSHAVRSMPVTQMGITATNLGPVLFRFCAGIDRISTGRNCSTNFYAEDLRQTSDKTFVQNGLSMTKASSTA